MREFLDALLAYPTVIYTSLMGLSLLYWFTVILGFLDLDLFDLDADLDVGLDGAMDGALDGAIDGAAEGAAEGALEAAEGVGADALQEPDLDLDADSPGGIAGILYTLGLAGVPLTISLSLVVLVGWVVCYYGMVLVGGLLPAAAEGGIVEIILGSGVGLVALVAGLIVTRFAVVPLKPVFVTQQASRRRDFVGKLCTVTTSRVSSDFGQGEIADGGSGLLVQIRVRDEAELHRGDNALVYEYDAEDEVYYVIPADS